MAAIHRLVIKGYKSIKGLDLQLGRVNVLIGPNAAGKSNFLSFFDLAGSIAMREMQIYVARAGGADTLLHYGSRATERISSEIYFGDQGYAFDMVPTADERLIFELERFVIGDDDATYEKTGHPESMLDKARTANTKRNVSPYFHPIVYDWRVYHFHDTSSSAQVRKTVSINDNRSLRPQAENLAAFLYLLQEKHPKHYALIRSAVQRVFPLFGDFLLRPNPLNEETIRLEWKEKGSDYPFGPHQISDGTLRFMCLATLLLQPNLPSTVLIDEPELGLHPAALEILGSLIRHASQRTQIILTTQSVTFLNEFQPEEIITVDRENGASVFRKHTSEELAAWLETYSISEIWEKNIIGGRP